MKWVNLPASWDLGSVRATSTLLISFSCVFGIWALGICRWKLHASKINKRGSVGLFGILEVSGVGDAVDATLAVCRAKRARRYWELLLQCAAVLLLAIVGILAGPIARYTVRIGHVIEETKLGGILTTTNNVSIRSALVKWNQTINRLDKAGFPYGELLDYLPDVNSDWQYRASEWNSSWTMSCNYVPRTNISVVVDQRGAEAAGIARGGMSELDEIPIIRSAYPSDFEDPENYTEFYSSAGVFVDDIYLDSLYFILLAASPPPSVGQSIDQLHKSNNETRRFVFMSLHVHNISSKAPQKNLVFGPGEAQAASYTIADCTFNQVSDVPDPDHVTYLWTPELQFIPDAFTDFYRVSATEQSIAQQSIHVPDGQELVRFFQAYMITKDTQHNHKVDRVLTARLPRVKVATVALALWGTYLVALGLVLAWSFTVYRLPRGLFVPRTKVDWMKESVREVTARDFDMSRIEAPAKQLCQDLSVWSYGAILSPSGKECAALRV